MNYKFLSDKDFNQILILINDRKACVLNPKVTLVLDDGKIVDFDKFCKECQGNNFRLLSENEGVKVEYIISEINEQLFFKCEVSGTNQVISKLSIGDFQLYADDDDKVSCELFTYSPDLNYGLIPKKGRVSVALSSLELRDMDSLMKGDGGRFIIPPYTCNVKLKDGEVLSFGSVDFSESIQGLQPVIKDRNLNFLFDYQGQIVLNKRFTTPFIQLTVNESYDEGIENYCKYLFENGKAKRPTQWESWWSGPVYCTIGDQAYASMMDTGSTVEADFDRYVNKPFTNEMLSIIKEQDLDFKMLIFDAGWMKNVATWEENTDRFPSFRQYIDDLREKGIHSILWYTPYNTQFNGKCEYIYEKHPEWILKNKSGQCKELLDYTRKDVRDFVASRLEYLLSDKDGCLNADGLKVDFYYHLYDEEGLQFFDPSYGTGEKLQYKVLKHIYDTAKEIKPNCYIEGSSANPMFNDTQDACRLNDDVTANPKIYEKRGWITTKTQCNLPDTDDWWSYKDYFVDLTIKKCVFGIPAIYAIKYRAEQGHMLLGYKFVAPGGNPVNIEQEEYNALDAIFKVYSNSPVNIKNKVEIDLIKRNFVRYSNNDKKEICCRTLNHNKVLYSKSANKIMFCALTDEIVKIDVSDYKVSKIYAVEKGNVVEVDYTLSDKEIIVNAISSAYKGRYYIVEIV